MSFIIAVIEGVTQSTLGTTVSSKKLNRAQENSLMMTTPERTFIRSSTIPYKNILPTLFSGKRKYINKIKTTTIDPQVPLMKDHNAFNHNNIYNDGNKNFNDSFSFAFITLCIIFFTVLF